VRIFTVFIILISASLLFAGNTTRRQIDNSRLFPLVKKQAKIIRPLYEPLNSADFSQHSTLSKTGAVRQTAAAYNRQVATSGNGYGWLNSSVRELDHFAGADADKGTPIDFLAVSYRGADASQIFESEIDLSGGFAGGAQYNSDALNDGFGGIGGRYPCMVALDRPFVSFNQYMEGNIADTPPISHAYTIGSYGTYGLDGELWTTPDFQMDMGWLNPTVNNFTQHKQNRLWNGPVSIVKDANGIYRYLSVYETWFSDPERSFYGVQTEKYIFTAKSNDGYPPDGWLLGVDEGHNPVRIDTAEVSLPRCGVSMNSTGFGVIAGPGHLGWHSPDSGYYYNTIRITYTTTEDYGLTWTNWDTVGMLEDLGIPAFIDSADHEMLWSIDSTQVNDTTWVYDSTYYHGPAFVGSNFDMSVLVDENKTIYVAFNLLWGAVGDNGWYPSYLYSGIWLAKKPYNGSWEAHRIAYNNGIWEGDDYVPGMSQYFFDTEAQISMDEWGNLYSAWLDRRHNNVQVSRFNRYSDPEQYGSFNDFKTDVYASYSTDGGVTWADPINCTDSPSLDEYELNMSIHSSGKDGNGTAWFAYVLADTASGNPAKDAYIEISNAVWVGQLDSLDVPVGIHDGAPQIVQSPVLFQNYPNPFNPSTKIQFVAGSNGQADLTVYTVTGQKIATLYNGKVRKGQKYDVTFDAQSLAAGVYFYRLTQNGFSDTKKMILIK